MIIVLSIELPAIADKRERHSCRRDEFRHTADLQEYLENITCPESQGDIFIEAVMEFHCNIQEHDITAYTYKNNAQAKDDAHFFP